MCTYTDVQRLPGLVRPAICYRFQLLVVHFDPERLPHQVRSRQFLGSRLQYRTSPRIDGSVHAKVHELSVFIATG